MPPSPSTPRISNPGNIGQSALSAKKLMVAGVWSPGWAVRSLPPTVSVSGSLPLADIERTPGEDGVETLQIIRCRAGDYKQEYRASLRRVRLEQLGFPLGVVGGNRFEPSDFPVLQQVPASLCLRRFQKACLEL